MNYRDDMLEGYLDSEEKFYDYGTDVILGNDIVDRKRTGVSYYNDFLNPKTLEYMESEKNLTGKVVMMSPDEYYKECAKHCWPGRNVTVEKLKYERGELGAKTIEKLKKVLTYYKRKLCMPMINYADPGQEGLHRMYVIGELYGWDFKVPVLQIKHFDDDRARKEQEEKRKSNIDWKVEKALQHAFYFEYTDKEEFENQLQYSLEREFQFIEDVKVPDEIHLQDNDESFILTFEGYEYPIEKDEIKWKEPEFDPDDEIDVGDFELSEEDLTLENEEFLKKYFGDDWRRTHPHLGPAFGIKESYEHNLTTKREVRYNENDISPFGYKVDFYKDGEQVGTASICGVGTDDPYLYDFMTLPEHRGEGYANDMMQHMIDEYDALHLYVDKDNYKAINLYKKFGWNIVGEAPEQEGQKPGWEMGRFDTDFIPDNIDED